MNKDQTTFDRNLKRFRRWLCENAVSRIVNGFLPTFLDDHSKKINVVVNDSMQPCTDGETIYVSLLPALLEDDYSEEEWLIILKAATAHEAQHVNSSNFDDVTGIREWYGNYLSSNYGLDSSIGKSIAKQALNIVEDGRIERIAVLRRPGMYYPFRFLNQIIRDGCLITDRSDTPAGEYKAFWGNILSYAKTGLYSPGIEAYERTELELVTLGIQNLIDKGVASNSSDDCRGFVQELLEDVSPYIVNLIRKDPNLEKSLKEQKTKDEYTSNKGEPIQDATASDNPLRASGSSTGDNSQEENDGQEGSETGEKGGTKNKSEKCSEENKGNGDSDSHQDSHQTGFSDSTKCLDPLNEQEMGELKKQMEKELTAANREEIASKKSSNHDSPGKSDIEAIRANYTGQTLPINYTTISIPGTNELPADLKAQALVLRREVMRIQEARSKFKKGLRRGTLDTGALWKTGLREDTIFSRKGNPDAGSIVFYLLMDNSGSMANPCSTTSVRKYQAARAAAAVIEEALRGLIACKIALFNQDHSGVRHVAIKDFGDNSKINHSWNSLQTIGPGGCNKDSVNIRIAASELFRRPERKKVLINLSDGLPSAYGGRSEAFAEVRQAVLDTRRKGAIMIPIMFGDEGFLKSSMKSYELMYEKNIIACDPKEITTRLCALFRQIISR